MRRTLEICAGDYASAVAANVGGADRIELCSGLGEGGLTPSMALIEQAVAIPDLNVHVLIRPRAGDFLYSDVECDIMVRDIELAVAAGADGVVVGCLKENGDVDRDMLVRFVDAAAGKSVTFHRAFDVCRNPLEAINAVADCGCNRLLTSGQAATAKQGISLLRQLVEVSGARIAIMAGCGVNPTNARAILEGSGVSELHASARVRRPSLMRYRYGGVAMGKDGADEYAIEETSVEIVRKLKDEMLRAGNQHG